MMNFRIPDWCRRTFNVVEKKEDELKKKFEALSDKAIAEMLLEGKTQYTDHAYELILKESQKRGITECNAEKVIRAEIKKEQEQGGLKRYPRDASAKLRWYSMLPESVKPLSGKAIRDVEYFQEKNNLPDAMLLQAIMTTRWAVMRIQKYTFEGFKKRSPGLPEKKIWEMVILNRLLIKLQLADVPETNPLARPLSKKEINTRMENIEKITECFTSFDDVVDYIIKMDEEENRFIDLPQQLELEVLLFEIPGLRKKEDGI